MSHEDFHQEINGRIYLQVSHLSGAFDLGPEKSGIFFKVIFDVMIKLQAMSYHIQNYTNLDKYYTEKTQNDFKNNPNEIKNCHSLLYELEAFLYQLKSSLDMTINIMDVLFPGHFGTHTFGKKGDQLIKNLKSFKRSKPNHISLIDDIISMVKNDKDSWLKKSVALRDTLCHYKTYTLYSYTVKECEGKLSVIKPKIIDYDPLQFMRVSFSNCIEFIQDLICLSITLYMPPAFCLTKPNIPNSWKEENFEKYIKYSLGLNMDKVTIKPPQNDQKEKKTHSFKESE